MKKILLLLNLFVFTIFISAQAASACNLIYVDGNDGNDANLGTATSPVASIFKALDIASTGDKIVVEYGVYNETNSLNLKDGITIEGAYVNTAGAWSKSGGLITDIQCGANEQINNSTEHIVGFKSNNVSNWKLIDLKIETTNATGNAVNGEGKSNYAIWINNSSNFEIKRCNVISGNATGGLVGNNGVAGIAGGDGSNGGNGGPGGSGGSGGAHNGGKGGQGGPGGGAFGSGPNGKSGSQGLGSGGAGGNGSSSGFSGSSNASNGNPGANGVAGANGLSLSNPITVSMGYYVPINGTNGINGTAGKGGGGGGGAGGTGFGANGGDGGGGGAGASPGTFGNAGTGGGSSFSIFENGSNGNLVNISLSNGSFGTGGNGGIGGAGNSGGSGGSGGSGTALAGNGGSGGKGGNSGSGGNGGKGADGISEAYYIVGTGASNPSTTINYTSLVSLSFQDDKRACVNSAIDLTKTSGSWAITSSPGLSYVNDLSASTSTYTNSSNVVEAYVSSTGSYNLGIDAVVLDNFINIDAARTLPAIPGTALEVICLGETKAFDASAWGTETDFKWELFSGDSALAANLIQTTTTDGLNYTFNTAGSFLIKYTVKESCCGWSIPIYKQIQVISGDNNAALAHNTSMNLVERCETNGWTYYASASELDKLLFAIDKNGNNFTASVDIAKHSAPIASIDNQNQHAAFIIGRTWNVNVTSGSIDPLQPVKIRFYMDANEISQAQTDASTYANAHGMSVNTIEFFKHPSAAFDPNTQMGNGNSFNFAKVALSAVAGVQNGINYYEMDNITSFSGGGAGFAVGHSGALLPVELISFEAETQNNNAIQLDWETATEINNSGFEVERSLDGVEFRKIAFVAGNGNTNEVQTYELLDERLKAGVYYYRLKQIDFDGNFEYSAVVSAQVEEKDENVVNYFVPNPSTSVTKIDIQLVSDSKVNFAVYDNYGRMVYVKDYNLKSGQQTLDFNTSSFSAGIYTARITIDAHSFTRKLVVRN